LRLLAARQSITYDEPMRWHAVLVATNMIVACDAGRETRAPASSTSQSSVASQALPIKAQHPLRAWGDRRIGGALVGAQLGDRSLLVISDEETQSIRIVEAASLRELTSIDLGGTPAQSNLCHHRRRPRVRPSRRGARHSSSRRKSAV